MATLVHKDATTTEAYHFDLLNWLRDGEYLMAARASTRPAGPVVEAVNYSRNMAQVVIGPAEAGQAYAITLSVRSSAGRIKHIHMLLELIEQQPFHEVEPDAPTNVVPAPALIHASSVLFDPDTGTEELPEPAPRPALILSAMSLAFPETAVGMVSETMSITMSNEGMGVLDIVDISVVGDFELSGIWPSTMAPGVSVPLSLSFKPTAQGGRSGSLTIASNDQGTPAVVSLAGEATAPPVPAPSLSLSPTSITFPGTNVGSSSAARNLTLTNTGTATLVVAEISIAGDFSRGVYQQSLQPGESMLVPITFAPTEEGARPGTASIITNAPGSPHSVPLSGTGIIPATSPFVTLQPTSLSFPSTMVGEVAPARTVTLSNTGNATLNIASITAAGDFQVASYPATLEPGQSTPLAVTFSPAIAGNRNGSLSIVSNASGSPHMVTLSGQGQGVPGEVTWLTADGNLLRDESGQQVMLRSINWFGFEQIFLPQGLWSRAYKTVTVGGVVHEGLMDLVARLGFNSMRITVSQDVTWPGSKPVTSGSAWNLTYVDPDMNPDLFTDLTNPWTRPQPTLTSIEILDRVVAHARELGMRIVLDLHCLAPNNDNIAGTNGKWYTTTVPGAPGATDGARGEPRSEKQTIDALVFLADRYKSEPTVCAIDLINEPHNCTWDADPLTGVVGFYERAGAAIQAVNPGIMLVCEGITGDIQFGNPGDPSTIWGTIWSGKLDEARNRPVLVPVANKVIYSPHEYGSYMPGMAGAAHQWFDQPSYPANMPEVWRRQWGYLAQEAIAPVWIGEFGSWVKAGATPNYTAQHEAWDAQWFKSLADYCNTYSIGFAYWTLNPEGEPDGLLGMDGENWDAPLPYKLTALAPFLAPPVDDEFFITDQSGLPITDESGTPITTEDA